MTQIATTLLSPFTLTGRTTLALLAELAECAFSCTKGCCAASRRRNGARSCSRSISIGAKSFFVIVLIGLFHRDGTRAPRLLHPGQVRFRRGARRGGGPGHHPGAGSGAHGHHDNGPGRLVHGGRNRHHAHFRADRRARHHGHQPDAVSHRAAVDRLAHMLPAFDGHLRRGRKFSAAI